MEANSPSQPKASAAMIALPDLVLKTSFFWLSQYFPVQCSIGSVDVLFRLGSVGLRLVTFPVITCGVDHPTISGHTGSSLGTQVTSWPVLAAFYAKFVVILIGKSRVLRDHFCVIPHYLSSSNRFQRIFVTRKCPGSERKLRADV